MLVEAVLASVIIGVGLSFITRGLGAQLHALGVMQETEALARLADEVLADMTREALTGQPPLRAAEGAFGPPHGAYRWTITAEPLLETDPDLLLTRITVRISRADGAGRTHTVSTLWPSAAVPAEWL